MAMDLNFKVFGMDTTVSASDLQRIQGMSDINQVKELSTCRGKIYHLVSFGKGRLGVMKQLFVLYHSKSYHESESAGNELNSLLKAKGFKVKADVSTSNKTVQFVLANQDNAIVTRFPNELTQPTRKTLTTFCPQQSVRNTPKEIASAAKKQGKLSAQNESRFIGLLNQLRDAKHKKDIGLLVLNLSGSLSSGNQLITDKAEGKTHTWFLQLGAERYEIAKCSEAKHRHQHRRQF
ncbi:MAG: hypothetical protein ACPGUD_03220 [Parashewanella sp.]